MIHYCQENEAGGLCCRSGMLKTLGHHNDWHEPVPLQAEGYHLIYRKKNLKLSLFRPMWNR